MPVARLQACGLYLRCARTCRYAARAHMFFTKVHCSSLQSQSLCQRIAQCTPKTWSSVCVSTAAPHWSSQQMAISSTTETAVLQCLTRVTRATQMLLQRPRKIYPNRRSLRNCARGSATPRRTSPISARWHRASPEARSSSTTCWTEEISSTGFGSSILSARTA